MAIPNLHTIYHINKVLRTCRHNFFVILFLAILLLPSGTSQGQDQQEDATVVISHNKEDEGERKMYNMAHEYLDKGLIPSTYAEEVVIDGYGLPGSQHEFRVELQASTFQCFYQRLQKNARFYLFFEVLRGADKNIDFEVIQPDGLSARSFQWTSTGTVDWTVRMDGIHSVCIDNRLSRFSSKVVFVYMSSYFEADWEKLSQELQDVVTSLSNFTGSFQLLDQNIKKMLSLVSVDTQQLVKDWYLIQDNNWYVTWLSSGLCVFFLVASIIQVLFVRKLFASPKTTPSAKPRA